MPYEINNKIFKTKKEIEDHFKKGKDKFKGRTSLLENDEELMKDFFELSKHHDEFNNKTKGMIDIIIKDNGFGHNAYFIIKENQTEDLDISYLHCVKMINKKNVKEYLLKKNLTSAMRFAIYPQIQSFRLLHHIKECELCRNEHQIEVDHIILFMELKKDFLIINKLPIPERFDDHPTRFFSVFKPDNKEFEKSWADYHKEHAQLRFLCQRCNRTRFKTINDPRYLEL
tara:strand:- start:43 stop:726 length:684 start_codon:yes stop_codon:yes gene_type:complete